MTEAFESSKAHGTLSSRKINSNRNAMSGKWVGRWKLTKDGELIRAKSLLISFGYQEREGVDYVEMFAESLNPTRIRLVLAEVN